MEEQTVKKDTTILVRTTTEEKRAAFQVAKEEGKTVSEIVRGLLKNVKPANQA